jgi:hypothetical protein
MLLLPDGTVMAQGGGISNSWTKLSPDSTGNYINGTWSNLTSMSTQRLYFGSNVLPSGNLFVIGGEYSGSSGAQNDTNTGEIYNPGQNSWTSLNSFPMSNFGDDPTMLLPNGQVLAGYLSGAQTFLFDTATRTWSQTGSKLRGDSSDEETWTLLPDGSVLSYDVFSSISTGVGHAQRYTPSTGTWVDAGTVPVPLSSTGVGYEMGPATLLPDGRVLEIGANGNSAIYSPSTNTWVAGPVLPAGLGADDTPGAMLPNGKFIFAADTTLFTGPTKLFEFDPSTNWFADVTPGGALGAQLGGAAYTDRMLVLPNGHVLLTTGSSTLWDYSPNGAPQAAWAPTITSVTQTAPNTYTLTGTQLTGLSAGASYGDDAEMDSNYPIVRLTNSSGVVKYATTSNWTPGVATGNASQTVQFTMPSGFGSDTYQLVVIANGITSTPVTWTVSSSSASQLAFQQAPPANGTAGTALSPAIKVAVQDASGNLMTGDSSTVTLTISNGTFASGATTVSAQAANGVATFSALVINSVGNYTLTASDGTLTTVTSSKIAINPAAAAQLVFVKQPPAAGTAGVALSPAIKVAVQDSFGNLVAGDSSTVKLTLSNGAFANGSTTVSVQAAGGVATFSALVINTIGNYTVKASDGALTAATSSSVAINPAAAAQLAFLKQPPATGTAGVALSPAIQVAVQDSFGNLVASDSSTVTLTLSSGTFGDGTTTVSVQAVKGVAMFSGLVINTAGSYTLSASDGSLTAATSGAVAINPAAASQVVFQSIPASGIYGVVLAPAVAVAVEDAFGNIVTGDTSTVTVSIATGPGVFTVASTLSVAAVNGVATFSNLILNTAGTYTLSAADDSLTVATSGTITINAITVPHLVVQQAPTTGIAGGVLAPASVAVIDQFGNAVPSNNSTVTLTLSSGTFTNGRNTATANISGNIATFSMLIINKAGPYCLAATSGTMAGASFGVTISPAAAKGVVYQQAPPATGTAGVTLSPAVTVAVQDRFGNLIASDSSSSVTLTLNSGTFANGSTTVTAPVSSGLATFSGAGLDLIINKTGSYKMTASDGVLTRSTSGAIAIAPAATSQMVFQSIPTTGTAGVVLASVKVALKDAFGNIATGDTSTVTLGIATGPASFTSASTLSVAAVNGVATFSNLILNKSGKYTLNAADGALPVPVSGTITINAAPATQLVLLQSPTTGTAGVALAPAVKVAVEDQFGNLVNAFSTVTLTISSGTFASGSTTATAGVSGGIATFSSLIINAAGNYTFSASDGTMSGMSFGVTINPAVASKLAFQQAPPATGTAGTALSPAVAVAVQDKYGNVVTGNKSNVTLTLSSGTFANGSKTVTAPVIGGVATFSGPGLDLIINILGIYSLIATDGTLTAVTSGLITIS